MDVVSIAKLANLTLTDSQQKTFAPQFVETLKYIDLINQLDTSSVAPTSQVTGLTNISRDDIIDNTRILQAPKTNKGFYVK